MQEFLTYKCDICGNTSADKESIDRCEASHKKPIDIIAGSYRRTFKQIDNYPDTIKIRFENGALIEYDLNYEQKQKQNTEN